MDGLTAEQEQRAQEIVARNPGWDIWTVREVIATGSGEPGCVRDEQRETATR